MFFHFSPSTRYLSRSCRDLCFPLLQYELLCCPYLLDYMRPSHIWERRWMCIDVSWGCCCQDPDPLSHFYQMWWNQKPGWIRQETARILTMLILFSSSSSPTFQPPELACNWTLCVLSSPGIHLYYKLLVYSSRIYQGRSHHGHPLDCEMSFTHFEQYELSPRTFPLMSEEKRIL